MLFRLLSHSLNIAWLQVGKTTLVQNLLGHQAQQRHENSHTVRVQHRSARSPIWKTLLSRGTREATDGVDVFSWSIPKNNLLLSLWGTTALHVATLLRRQSRTVRLTRANHGTDFAGQDLYYTTRQFFISDNAISLLLFDARLNVQENRIIFWLNSLQVPNGQRASRRWHYVHHSFIHSFIRTLRWTGSLAESTSDARWHTRRPAQ